MYFKWQCILNGSALQYGTTGRYKMSSRELVQSVVVRAVCSVGPAEEAEEEAEKAAEEEEEVEEAVPLVLCWRST